MKEKEMRSITLSNRLEHCSRHSWLLFIKDDKVLSFEEKNFSSITVIHGANQYNFGTIHPNTRRKELIRAIIRKLW